VGGGCALCFCWERGQGVLASCPGQRPWQVAMGGANCTRHAATTHHVFREIGYCKGSRPARCGATRTPQQGCVSLNTACQWAGGGSKMHPMLLLLQAGRATQQLHACLSNVRSRSNNRPYSCTSHWCSLVTFTWHVAGVARPTPGLLGGVEEWHHRLYICMLPYSSDGPCFPGVCW
jgi:hypothetical protein